MGRLLACVIGGHVTADSLALIKIALFLGIFSSVSGAITLSAPRSERSCVVHTVLVLDECALA
ncbi:MAG: hypothetical protein DWI12_03845 [Planctomycetota bacterium]|nr:MAG: hypothetical protein DWI12_03845 [Planctomycetota bacterium]